MKSQNELIISGIVVSDVPDATAGQSVVRFRLAHNFGGGRETLFLPCVVFQKTDKQLSVPGKGTAVAINATLSAYKGQIQAIVKHITTI